MTYDLKPRQIRHYWQYVLIRRYGLSFKVTWLTNKLPQPRNSERPRNNVLSLSDTDPSAVISIIHLRLDAKPKLSFAAINLGDIQSEPLSTSDGFARWFCWKPCRRCRGSSTRHNNITRGSPCGHRHRGPVIVLSVTNLCWIFISAQTDWHGLSCRLNWTELGEKCAAYYGTRTYCSLLADYWKLRSLG